MGNYVISCCSTADLSKDHFDAIDVKYICFHFELDGKQYEDNLGVSIPFDEFYSRMANGADTKTSQVNAEEFEEYFRSFLEQGLDILHESVIWNQWCYQFGKYCEGDATGGVPGS